MMLLLVTLALGIEFGGSGLAGASGGFGTPSPISKQTKQNSQLVLPEFVVRAQGVNPKDLYASGSFKSVPDNMTVPLVGLHITLLSQEESSLLLRRIPTITLTTNASGIAATFLVPGDYDVQIAGSTFGAYTTVTMIGNITATLNVQLQPSGVPVGVIRLVSPDSVSGVEPSSKFFALIDNATAPAPGFAELVGFGPESSSLVEPGSGNPSYVNVAGPLISLNSTLQGTYPGTEGYWAALSPTAPYSAYPTQGVMLFQFEPLVEVNYTAR